MSGPHRIPGVLLLLFLVVGVQFSSGIIQETSIPVNMVGCFQKMTTPKLTPSHRMEYCLFQEGVNTVGSLPGGINITENHPWFKELQGKLETQTRTRRDAKPKCQRKEYRYMTVDERNKWHQAVNMLKTDKSVYPNKYDALALLHATNAARTAFGGPSFLAWNRQYYALFEQACHEKIHGLVMPYWDLSLDSHLMDLRESIIWSQDFLGSSEGPVNEGPFSDWHTPYGPLNRQIGNFGSFPSIQTIENILKKEHLGDILYPNAEPDCNLEYLMTSALNVIGGQVASFHSAAVDPAYFLISGYFDYVWSLFQEKQIEKKIHPDDDYPSFYGDLRYAPASPLRITPITIKEALSPIYGQQRFVYHHLSACGAGCKSPHLMCVNQRCVPRTRLPGCSNPLPAKSFQNTFCVDGECDTSLWSYIPVRVVNKRAPNYPIYNSFAVQKGRLVTTKDIYDAQSYSFSSKYFKSKTVRTNEPYNCRRSSCCGGVSSVQVSSTGMNYHGTYKDYALVDERLAVATGETYVAVKNPKFGSSQAVVRAYDSCGRVCRPACRIPGSVPAAYAPCSGVIQLTSQQPFGYGDDLGYAYLNMYDFRVDPLLPPSTAESAVYLTFYCNVDLQWPFEEDSFNTMALLSPLFQNQQVSNIHSYPFPDPGASTTVCKVSFMCDIPINCNTCRLNGGKAAACNRKCGEYAECIYGQYQHRLCPGGCGFNPKTLQCDPSIKCPRISRASAIARAVAGSGGSAHAQASAKSDGAAFSNAKVVESNDSVFSRAIASANAAAIAPNSIAAASAHSVVQSRVGHRVAKSKAGAAAFASSVNNIAAAKSVAASEGQGAAAAQSAAVSEGQGTAAAQGAAASRGQGAATAQGAAASGGLSAATAQGKAASLGQGAAAAQSKAASLGQGSAAAQGKADSLGQGTAAAQSKAATQGLSAAAAESAAKSQGKAAARSAAHSRTRRWVAASNTAAADSAAASRGQGAAAAKSAAASQGLGATAVKTSAATRGTAAASAAAKSKVHSRTRRWVAVSHTGEASAAVESPNGIVGYPANSLDTPGDVFATGGVVAAESTAESRGWGAAAAEGEAQSRTRRWVAASNTAAADSAAASRGQGAAAAKSAAASQGLGATAVKTSAATRGTAAAAAAAKSKVHSRTRRWVAASNTAAADSAAASQGQGAAAAESAAASQGLGATAVKTSAATRGTAAAAAAAKSKVHSRTRRWVAVSHTGEASAAVESPNGIVGYPANSLDTPGDVFATGGVVAAESAAESRGWGAATAKGEAQSRTRRLVAASNTAAADSAAASRGQGAAAAESAAASQGLGATAVKTSAATRGTAAASAAAKSKVHSRTRRWVAASNTAAADSAAASQGQGAAAAESAAASQGLGATAVKTSAATRGTAAAAAAAKSKVHSRTRRWVAVSHTGEASAAVESPNGIVGYPANSLDTPGDVFATGGVVAAESAAESRGWGAAAAEGEAQSRTRRLVAASNTAAADSAAASRGQGAAAAESAAASQGLGATAVETSAATRGTAAAAAAAKSKVHSRTRRWVAASNTAAADSAAASQGQGAAAAKSAAASQGLGATAVKTSAATRGTAAASAAAKSKVHSRTRRWVAVSHTGEASAAVESPNGIVGYPANSLDTPGDVFATGGVVAAESAAESRGWGAAAAKGEAQSRTRRWVAASNTAAADSAAASQGQGAAAAESAAASQGLGATAVKTSAATRGTAAAAAAAKSKVHSRTRRWVAVSHTGEASAAVESPNGIVGYPANSLDTPGDVFATGGVVAAESAAESRGWGAAAAKGEAQSRTRRWVAASNTAAADSAAASRGQGAAAAKSAAASQGLGATAVKTSAATRGTAAASAAAKSKVQSRTRRWVAASSTGGAAAAAAASNERAVYSPHSLAASQDLLDFQGVVSSQGVAAAHANAAAETVPRGVESDWDEDLYLIV